MPAPTPAPLAELQLLLDDLGAAWRAGDATRYAAQFTDADYVAFDGRHLKGRAAIARQHQELFGGIRRGSELVSDGLTDCRLLSEQVALLHTTGAVRLRWQKAAPASRGSIQTLVAVREAGRWKFAAFQNTRIAPPGFFARLLLRWLK